MRIKVLHTAKAESNIWHEDVLYCMPREHNEQGNFIETVTHGDVLGILDTVDGPVILSADVADELECSRDTARRKLSELHEQGKLDRRKVSRRIIYWEAEPETDSDASDRAHTAMLAGAETATETDAPEDSEIREALRGHFETDAGPATRRPQEALIDLVLLLREAGPMQKKDAETELYSKYTDYYSGPKTMWDSLSRYFGETPGIGKLGRGEYDFSSIADILIEARNE
jgi:hypothetical protein